jgi:hypothetical protein
MSAPTPVLIPEPFAAAAGPSFINTIPATTADPQRAAYDEGFPPLTFQSEGSGGLPPLGQDFNGILNAITQHLFALQGGQLQTYRADVSTALGGYGKGAILAMTDGARMVDFHGREQHDRPRRGRRGLGTGVRVRLVRNHRPDGRRTNLKTAVEASRGF